MIKCLIDKQSNYENKPLLVSDIDNIGNLIYQVDSWICEC